MYVEHTQHAHSTTRTIKLGAVVVEVGQRKVGDDGKVGDLRVVERGVRLRRVVLLLLLLCGGRCAKEERGV